MITESELSEVIRLAMDGSNAKIRTAFPARITAFDADAGPTASVQPAIQAAYWDADLEEPVFFEMPEITNCPVHYPAGGGFQITYPLEAGDDCLVLIAERSIDEWMATGNASNIPRMLRRFDLSDAIVIPGLRPNARALTNVDTGALQIRNENGSVMRVNDDGTVYLGNSLADLVAETEDLATETNNIVTALASLGLSLSGAADPVVAGAGSALGVALAPIAAALATIQAQLALLSE